MTNAYVIETRDRAAGIAVRERSGFRFFAAAGPFYALDQRTFRHLAALRSAVEEVAARDRRPPRHPLRRWG
jgi:hypothetical protein